MADWQKLIIGMDGYFHQVLLTGKKRSKQQLKQKYLEAKALTFKMVKPAIFCRIHHFKEIPYESDMVVDLLLILIQGEFIC